MKNKEVRGILALIVVTALSFGVIAGSRALSVDMAGDGAQGGSAAVAEELDVSGAETIEEAARLEDGAYAVTVRTAGYAGDIVMRVTFEDDAETIRQVEVLEQNETETLGSRITEPEFLDQFAGAKAPVYLPGMTVEAADASGESGALGAEAEESAAAEAGGAAAELLSDLEGAVLADGTYEAKAAEASNGYTDQVTITVADGKITEVNWEAVAEDGSLKSVLSENGEYVMTEDGLTWAEQSKALADALIENQSLSFLNPDAEGKTDAVSGVSISVNGFISLAQQCIDQAAGIESTADTETEAAEETTEAAGGDTAAQNGTQVDGVSGATRSSTAAVTAINEAYSFLQTVK